MEISLLVIFWAILIFSIAMIPFNLPGTFVIVFATFGYQFVDKTSGIKWSVILILISIAIGLELFEYFLTAWSSKKYGGSKWGTAGAIIGSILGAIFGTSFLPFIGSILGAFLGGFIGAYIMEFIKSRNMQKSYNVGKGAFIGMVGGKTGKIIGAIAMVIIVATSM